MTTTLLRRIGTLESRCSTVQAQRQLHFRVVLIAVDSKVGVGKATCRRSRGQGGGLFEIIDFYGCAFGEGEPSPEEQAFAAWIETVPIDGVQREFGGAHEAL